MLTLNQSVLWDYRGKTRLKNFIIVFPMTCSRSFTFIITFYWTTLHKPGANREFLLETIQRPREWVKSLSTDNLGLSFNTQISFTFTALLYGSTADLCEAEWKTISWITSLHFRASEAQRQQLRMGDTWRLDCLFCGFILCYDVLPALFSILCLVKWPKTTNRCLAMPAAGV